MDPNIRAILQAGRQAQQSEQAARAAHAREAKAKKAAAAKSDRATASAEAVQLAAIVCPSAGNLLGVKAPSTSQTPLLALARLAVSPKVRGSGSEVDRVRRLQHLGYALVGKTVLERQEQGLQVWLHSGNVDGTATTIRGLSAMWDEATQRMRGVLEMASQHKLLGSMRAQKLGEVMVVLASVMSAEIEHGELQGWVWEPWMCPPLAMNNTKHTTLLEGLNRVLPVNFDDDDSLKAFASGARIVMLVFCADFASSNIAAVLYMLGALRDLPMEDAPLALHTERCLTHALHIIKSAALAQHTIASQLFAVSKVVAHSRSMDGLVRAMKAHVEARLEIVHGEPPDPAQLDLMAVIKLILSIDGDDSLISVGRQKKRRTKWLEEIQTMCQRSHFDRHRGMWLYYVQQEPASAAGVSRDDMVSFVLEPLLQVLVQRRWEVASLNRWNGTIRCLKRMVLGCVLNGVLPESLAGLSGSMELTEAKVNALLEEHARRQAAGETEGDPKWLLHCKRVIRLSVFFRLPDRRWQMGAVLLAASTIDRLHWAVTGFLGNPKLTLTSLVDPTTSKVVDTSSDIREMMATWRFNESPWSLLQWLGVTRLEEQHVMMFCRGLLTALSAGLFLHVERRFACWPYKLQHLLSANTTAEQKMLVMVEFRNASPCCLGPFATALRKVFPTIQSMQTAQFIQTLRMFEALLKFSTSPVENEHKIVKDHTFSLTSGTSIAPACWRSICRHLNMAFLQRGGVDTSVSVGRSTKLALGTGPTLELPPLPPSATLTPLEDATTGGDQEVEGIKVSDIGGGNPKVCFLNYRTKKFAQQHKGATKDLIKSVRDAAVAEYDKDERVQERWTRLFRFATLKRKTAATQGARVDSGAKGASQQLAVWKETLQTDGAPIKGPVSQAVLSEAKGMFAPTPAAFNELALDDKRFRPEPPTGARRQPASRMWGCGCELKNACRRFLSLNNALRTFENLQTALNRHIDSLPKQEVRGVHHAFLLQSETPEGNGRAIWLLLAKAMYNPKVQVFIKCVPQGTTLDEHGFSVVRAAPFDLLMMSKPSRLCCVAEEAFGIKLGLYHQTSEEVIQSMALAGGEWSVAGLKYKIKVDAGSLLEMEVEAIGDLLPLRPRRPVNSGQDAVQRFLRLPRGRPSELAPVADAPSPNEGGPSGHEAAGGGDAAAMAENEAEMAFDAEFLEVAMEELGMPLGSDGEPNFDLERELAELLGAEDAVADEEVADEGEEEDADANIGPGGDLAGHGADDASPEVASSSGGDLLAVGEAAALAVGDEQDPAPQIPEGSECNEGRTLWMTPLGYVFSSNPPHTPNRTLGLVSYQQQNRVLFANCHLHPHCNIRCGIVREDVPRFRLAQWLAMGAPCADLSVEERKQRGKEHRALWTRVGPFPE